jgi:signal transduction histidine kinase
LRDWPVRGRLVALIVVPTLVAVALGGVGVAEAARNAVGDRHAHTLAQLGSALTDLVQQAQNEQTAAAVYVASGRSAADLQALRASYAPVDAAAGPVRGLLAQIGDSYPETTRTRASTVAFRGTELRNLRSVMENSQLPVNVVISRYTDMITDLLALDDEIAVETADPSLGASVRALGAVSRDKMQLGVQRSLVAAALAAHRFELGGFAALTDAISAQKSAYNEFQVAATSAQAQQYAFAVTGKDVDETQTVLNQVTSSGGNWVATAPAGAAQIWSDAASGTMGKIRSVESALTAEITARAADLADSAMQRAVLAGVIALAVVIVVLAATVMVARSLVLPLRALRNGALTVADRRLPDLITRLRTQAPQDVEARVAPIEVDSADEIGQVARAFDEVHRVASRLAGEQAGLRDQVNALFVNLSRRSQTLVERQLDVIDSLEREEQDSVRLQKLFVLDHLATRMRRNGDNLLVLGGQEPNRRFTEAMPLFDVLRAAASEVERYELIDVAHDLPDVHVAESAVTDVVHLVAELLDNATVFSPPDERVRVRARPAERGGVQVEIVDQGLGMPAEDLAEANADLADPPLIQPGVSRRMGLFVVGRLARRHGIVVRLAAGRPHGLVVLAGLPPLVVVDPRRLAVPEPQNPFSTTETAVPGWPGQRWVAAMNAPGSSAASWFGEEPLPAITQSTEPVRASRRPLTSGGESSVGLPLRVPGANYVPGSLPAEDQDAPGEQGGASWEQSPDALRARFAAYQAGARRGHSAAERQVPGDRGQPAATGRARRPLTSGGESSVGLPLRVPGANYVPGSLRAEEDPATAEPTPPRQRGSQQTSWDSSPEALRARFAAYQAGARRGHHAAGRADREPTWP